jgi:hypothetical protein
MWHRDRSGRWRGWASTGAWGLSGAVRRDGWSRAPAIPLGSWSAAARGRSGSGPGRSCTAGAQFRPFSPARHPRHPRPKHPGRARAVRPLLWRGLAGDCLSNTVFAQEELNFGPTPPSPCAARHRTPSSARNQAVPYVRRASPFPAPARPRVLWADHIGSGQRSRPQPAEDGGPDQAPAGAGVRAARCVRQCCMVQLRGGRPDSYRGRGAEAAPPGEPTGPVVAPATASQGWRRRGVCLPSSCTSAACGRPASHRATPPSKQRATPLPPLRPARGRACRRGTTRRDGPICRSLRKPRWSRA